MALTSHFAEKRRTVIGRVLARNGQVSLINNVLTRPLCAAGSTPPSCTPGDTGGGSSKAQTRGPFEPGSGHGADTETRAASRAQTARRLCGRAPRETCTSGFRATVSGHKIKRVVFSLDGKTIGSRTGVALRDLVRAAPGSHQVGARVTFTDATRAKTMTLPYRACAAAVLHPHRGSSHVHRMSPSRRRGTATPRPAPGVSALARR